MNAQSSQAPENEALARFVLNEMENSVLYRASEDERKRFRELNGFTVDISKTMVRTEKLETIRMSPYIMDQEGKGIPRFNSCDRSIDAIIPAENANDAKEKTRDFLLAWLNEEKFDYFLNGILNDPKYPSRNPYFSHLPVFIHDFFVCMSAHVYSCPSCRGMGEITCPVCSGDGSHKCFSCRGTGVCPSCGGKMYIKCHDCGGRGETRTTCCVCNGRGTTDPNDMCLSCMGAGIIRHSCDTCGGRGIFSCTKCIAGMCPECHGGKTVACEKCNAGMAKCDVCNGSGLLYTGCIGTFTVERKISESDHFDGDEQFEDKEKVLAFIRRTPKNWHIDRKEKVHKELRYACASSCSYPLYRVTVTAKNGKTYLHYAIPQEDGWALFSCDSYASLASDMLWDIPAVCGEAGLFHGDLYATLEKVGEKAWKVSGVKEAFYDLRDAKAQKVRDSIQRLVTFSWLRPVLAALVISGVFFCLVPLAARHAAQGAIALLTEGVARDFVEAIVETFFGYRIYEDVFLDKATWMPIFTCLFACLAMLPGYLFLKRALRKRKAKFRALESCNHELYSVDKGAFSGAHENFVPLIVFFAETFLVWIFVFGNDFRILFASI